MKPTSDRISGFYWVRFKSCPNWEVAYWNNYHCYWTFNGTKNHMQDVDLDEIDEFCLKREKPMFKPGTVVVFEPNNFNPDFWNNLPEEDRVKYYGPIGYGYKNQHGLPTKKLFVFLCEIKNAPGHCVLVSMDDQSVITMRHTSDFREVTEDEI